MEGLELFEKIDRVKAPGGFENAVLARLPGERKKRARQRATFRFAMAGSAAALVVGVVLAAVFIAGGGGERRYADLPGLTPSATAPYFADRLGGTDARSFIPVLETVNYSAEVRNAYHGPRTVYILEQVSEAMPSGIKY